MRLSVLGLTTVTFFLRGVPECHRKKLQVLQNSAPWVVTFTKKFDHITPILYDLHWLPVEGCIKGNRRRSIGHCPHLWNPPQLRTLLCRLKWLQWRLPKMWAISYGSSTIAFKILLLTFKALRPPGRV